MNYQELVVTISSREDFHRDLLINALSEIGFDTFQETPEGFNGYVPVDVFDQSTLDAALDEFKEMIDFSVQINFIPEKNWNEVWESNFEPLIIGDECYVRATFHNGHPEYKYEIIIDPKMSFGTGHHQTTSLMIEYMLTEDFNGKSVLDMGCGTAILGILASKAGALEVTAIDYDPICYASTLENAILNDIHNITALLGSKEAIPDHTFNVILANINRNILLDQIDVYSKVLTEGGFLYMSGFYDDPDLKLLVDKAVQYQLYYVDYKVKDNWVAAKFVKQSFK